MIKLRFNSIKGRGMMTLPVDGFAALADANHNWPGIKSIWCGFIDPIFGRYNSLKDLDQMEYMAAEEETDDYMDATAQSVALESAALEAADIENKASVHTDEQRAELHGRSEELTDRRSEGDVEDVASCHESNPSPAECEIDGPERSQVPGHVVEEYLGGGSLSSEPGVPGERADSSDLPLIKVRTT